MKHRSGASKSHHKDGHGGGKEVKYRGVTRQASGRYSAKICKTFLGMFATAEEAARAYDRAAFASRGHMVILNFPAEYSGAVAAAANASINAATSSSSMATRKEYLKLECVDKLKEDLLDPENAKNKD